MVSQHDFFDSQAQQWESTCYPKPVRDRLCRFIDSLGIASGDRLLDVGTGPGVLLPYLRKQVGAAGQICALDLSPGMIREAARKPRTSRDLIIRADVHQIPFNDNFFDHVICFGAFPHFDHPSLAMREMARVVKRGGIIVIAHLMSRLELARRRTARPCVANDMLQDDKSMRDCFRQAMVCPLKIIDRPGLYVARGIGL